ncbi:Intersectin-2 [Kappamyces sp. JEL0829]|nr:Intersectin-2 [Kappamyces sp. JEL0829]
MMVRSKTSYSVHITAFSALDAKLKTSQGSDYSLKDSKEHFKELPGDVDSSVEDGFLRDLDLKGFHGLWNHPVTRLYILMYLIWRKQENLYILRMEILEYRSTYLRLTPSQRNTLARRIFKSYLSPNALFEVHWPSDTHDPSIDEVTDKLMSLLETPDIAIFDDFGYLSLQAIEKAYNGQFQPSAAADESPKEPKDSGFRHGPFYQAMKNDLGGTSQITTDQYRRAAERVIDTCNNLNMEMGAYESILMLLGELGLESEFIRKDEKKKQQQISMTKSSSNIMVEDLTSPVAAKSPTWMYETTASANHAFLPAKKTPSLEFCEYCFEVAGEGEKLLYSCETCGIKSHKNCRNFMAITCTKTSLEKEKLQETESTDAIRLVQEKLIALQREVDIELKIQEGLEKLVKAKKISKASKKNVAENDILAQLEKNTKRLDVLKHEMQKRKVQLQTMQLTLAATPAPRHVLSKKGSSNKFGADLVSASATSEPIIDTGLLRVVVIDPNTKLEFKKAIYVTENQSTVEVIEMILNKFNLPGTPNEFALLYSSSEGGTKLTLKDEDRPNQIEDINYANTIFYLHSRTGNKPSPSDDPLVKKQQEIVNEILESELKYLDDLKLVDTLFYEPLQQAGLLSEAELHDVFFNIRDIIRLHEKIGRAIDDQKGLAHMQKISKLIESFTDAVGRLRRNKQVSEFHCYELYCGNQYQQRATLKKKQATNASLAALIQQCEANPKLHKLGIADMLMKPMQKITRYPLLLKRLLPNLITDSPEFKSLSHLITDMEKSICDVNETVRKMEAKFRIKMIDQTMDFGLVFEKFRIAADGRDLILENTLQYVGKTGMPTEVIVLLFSDMILITKRSKKIEGGYTLFKTPIALENVVFIDHTSSEGKRGFQIAHLKSEIHTILAYSVFDKKSWLQEADATRAQYLSIYTNFELTYMRLQLSKYKGVTYVKTPLSAYLDDGVGSTSYLGSFFFTKSKNRASEDSGGPEGEMQRNLSKKVTMQISPLHATIQGETEHKISSVDLLNAKKRLSHVPSARNLVKLASFKNMGSKSSMCSLLTIGLAQDDGQIKANYITTQELEFGKTKLASLKNSERPQLAKSGSFNNLKASSGNLMEKIKKTFKSKLNDSDE